ncbi:MAG TPA: glycosyltransferase family A protein [Parvibaculum sp.]
MAEICCITTCMGRLEHLKQTLPRTVAQPGVSVVVVDYSCPDGAGDWVEANFPQVRVVRVEGETLFSRSRARNLGAAATDAPWLAFLDADVLIDPGFFDAVRPLLRPGRFYSPHPAALQTYGALIVERSAVVAAGGDDETFVGWGSEDIDVLEALRFEGLKAAQFPGGLLGEIPHSNELRTAVQSHQDLWFQGQINSVYRGIKSDFRRLLNRKLTADETRLIYAEVSRVLIETEKMDRFAPSWIRINLDAFGLQPSPIFDQTAITQVERSITYKIRLEKQAADGVALIAEPTE